MNDRLETARVDTTVPHRAEEPDAWRWTLPPLLIFSALAAAFKVRSFDTFWHLAAGRWILDHRQLPDPDPLRFTAEGHRWIDHEWLFQVGLAAVETWGGLPALVGLRILGALVIAGLLWLVCRRAGASAAASTLLSGLGVFLARPRFLLRPELFSLVALALLLWLLLRYRERPTVAAGLHLALLTAIWANTHPAVLMAPILAAAFLLGSWTSRSAPLTISQIAWPPVALFAATLLNPAGYRLWWVPVEISGALDDLAGTNPEWLPQWKQPLPGYLFLLVALLVATGWLWRRYRRFDPGTAAVALVLALLGATSVRQLAPFALGAILHLARCQALAPSPSPRTRRFPRSLLWGTASLGLLLLYFPPHDGPLQPRQGRYAPGVGLQENRFPKEATDFVAAHPEIGRLYNNVAYGGYLLWRLHPPRRVFNDGRNELNPGFLRELAEARSDGRLWYALLERYDVGGALVRYDERRRPVVAGPPSGAAPGSEIEVQWLTSNEVLFPRSEFALVHWDDVAMVLLDRRPEHRELIEAFEYRWVRPEDIESITQDAQDPERRLALLAELRRKLLEDPDSVRAQRLVDQLQKGPVSLPPGFATDGLR